jgi:membrane protease YdiL (CAAX protease family)
MFTKNKLIPPVIAYTLCYAILNLALFFVFQPGNSVSAWLETKLVDAPFLRLGMLFVIQELLLIGLLIIQFFVYAHQVTWKHMRHFFAHQFQWKWWWVALHVVGGAFLLYFLINAFLLLVTQTYDIHIPWLFGEQLVMKALTALPFTLWWQKMGVVLAVVLIGPLVEEIIYRGFATKLLTQAVGKRWVVIAAVLFSLAHMEWWVVINLFILALLLWVVYHKTQSLRYSLLFHMLINGMAVGVLFFAPPILG